MSIDDAMGGFSACRWMDYYTPRAWRLVFVADPAARVPSMYYYAAKFTVPARSTLANGSTVIHPLNNDARLQTPLDATENQHILQFIAELGSTNWEYVQWRWLAEGTSQRTVDEVTQMLRNGAFIVGLTEHFDESLMLIRHCMGLFVEDILYVRLKAELPHPSLADWSAEAQSRTEQFIASSGDRQYYTTARRVFEKQVQEYGGWAKLRLDTEMFRAVQHRLALECDDVLGHADALPVLAVVAREAVCLVAKYRQHGMAAQFGEL